MSEVMPHLSRPCAECPWRKDTKPGQFTEERYRALRGTTGDPGREAPLGAPLFACHKSHEGKEMPCAGWLASVGVESIPVRLLVIWERLPDSVLKPGPDWPPLFTNYEEMAAAQGRKESDGTGDAAGGCPRPLKRRRK